MPNIKNKLLLLESVQIKKQEIQISTLHIWFKTVQRAQNSTDKIVSQRQV